MCVDHPAHTIGVLLLQSYRELGRWMLHRREGFRRQVLLTPKLPPKQVALTSRFLQAKHRAPKLESYLRGLDNGTRAALLRELQGTLRELYSHVLRAFGV
jgi:hypothetical protein